MDNIMTILSFAVVILSFVTIVTIFVKEFVNLPSSKQIEKVKEWLLFAVIAAEKEFGGGTGAIKLRSVYDNFLTKFPAVARAISFEFFSNLVDEVLEKMEALLLENKQVESLVKEGEN